jgi:hypothetical protein
MNPHATMASIIMAAACTRSRTALEGTYSGIEILIAGVFLLSSPLTLTAVAE